MKFSLTVNTDNVADISAIMQLFGGPANGLGQVLPSVAFSTPDADDTPPPVGTATPSVDSTGLPWDERIHAKSKGTNQNGSWKRGRGVSDETAAAVERELRARMAPPIPATMGAPVQPVFTPSPVQPNSHSPQVTVAPVQAAPPAYTPAPQPQYAPPAAPQPQFAHTPAQPAQIQPQPQPSGYDFNALMMGLQRGMGAGVVDLNVLNGYIAEINNACQTQFGQITDLATRPDLVNYAVQLLQRDNRWIAA